MPAALESGETRLPAGTLTSLRLAAVLDQLSAAWPRSMMAYLAEFWDNSTPQGAIMLLTLFHRGRSVRSDSHSPTLRPDLNSPSAQL